MLETIPPDDLADAILATMPPPPYSVAVMDLCRDFHLPGGRALVALLANRGVRPCQHNMRDGGGRSISISERDWPLALALGRQYMNRQASALASQNP